MVLFDNLPKLCVAMNAISKMYRYGCPRVYFTFCLMLFFGIACLPCLSASGNPATFKTEALVQRKSIAQFGITWTFDKAYGTGQYANGDYWVIGPVKIIHITPASVDEGGRIKNGSQLNPVIAGDQGYDSAKGDMGFNAEKNIGRPGGKDLSEVNPIMISTGSLISTVSLHTLQPRPQLKTAAILTVVASAPPAGAFRPPPVGTDKTSFWNKSNLNYSILKSLPPVADTPALSQVEKYFEKPWLEQNPAWTARFIHPADNQACYGREMAIQLGEGLLSLHLNYSNAQKETLFIRMIQYGIDVYGSAKAGAIWEGYGGHNQGRKLPMLLAGLALKDSNILEYADASKHFIFQEDHQTWYVTQKDVGRALTTKDKRPREPYIQADVGIAEWGEQHARAENRDGRNWDAYYREICVASEMSHALATHLTPGAKEIWNWPAFFDYMDRAFGVEQSKNKQAGTNAIPPFVVNMWKAYRKPAADR